MISRRSLWASFISAFLLLELATAAPAEAQTRALRVFAASSVTDAFNQIADLYAAKGHSRPVFNYASSSVLAKQIEQGAQADLFVSADEAWMDYLAERKLVVATTRTSFLSNKLVLVAPIGQPLTLRIAPGFDLAGALKGGKLAMADPDSVPAGKYGRAALQSLGVWSAVEGSVARAENVRAALRFVETGNAPAGIVYLTDQMASKEKVALVGEFPPLSYPKISYPIAAVRGGDETEAASFEAFLQSAEAKAVFVRLGFILK
jgi:molybdate transport system substrate-binding protein